MKEKLIFRNSKGNKLWGIISKCALKKGNPIIIMCHGFSSTKDGQTYIRPKEALNEERISTFRFGFFGHGESEGKFRKDGGFDFIVYYQEFLRRIYLK